jgi:hypothetical protein
VHVLAERGANQGAGEQLDRQTEPVALGSTEREERTEQRR